MYSMEELRNLCDPTHMIITQHSRKRFQERGIRISDICRAIENGEIIAKSHYAVLVKWVNYRVDKAEEKELDESKPKMSNMEKSWIASMKKVEMM